MPVANVVLWLCNNLSPVLIACSVIHSVANQDSPYLIISREPIITHHTHLQDNLLNVNVSEVKLKRFVKNSGEAELLC